MENGKLKIENYGMHFKKTPVIPTERQPVEE